MIPLIPLSPRIRKIDDKLVAKTGWFSFLLSLGLWTRTLILNPDSKTLTIKSRFLWFFSSRRRLPFRDVSAVTYKYEDESFDQWFSFSHISQDSYSVGLRLVNFEEVPLFSFYGGGSFVNNSIIPDWFYWPQLFAELPFSQEQPSRMFVEVLSRLLDVEVIPGS